MLRHGPATAASGALGYEAIVASLWKNQGVFKKLFSRTPRKTHRLTVRSLGRTVEIPEHKTLLDGALDADLPYPHSCCHAECGTCLSQLVAGEIREEVDTSHLVSPAQKRAGFFLACQAKLVSDEVVVDLPGYDGAVGRHPLLTTDATLVAVRPLCHDILEVELELSRACVFTAGQYAELAVPGVVDEPRNYSFAAAPTPERCQRPIFHIRKVPGGAFTEWLHGADRVGSKLRFTGPRGQFALRPGGGPILAIAGGSGLAPIFAILEQALAQGSRREVVLLFGARRQADLYAREALLRLQAQWPVSFELREILSEEEANSGWSGRRGFVTSGISELSPELLASCQAYLAGPPPMIDAAISELSKYGIGLERIFFDKFFDKSHRPAVS